MSTDPPQYFVRPQNKPFKLEKKFEPAGDQPEAIKVLNDGMDDGLAFQTLLG